MSIIKRLDDISETNERSKSLSEAISKVEAAMNRLKGSNNRKSSARAKGEKEEA